MATEYSKLRHLLILLDEDERYRLPPHLRPRPKPPGQNITYLTDEQDTRLVSADGQFFTL